MLTTSIDAEWRCVKAATILLHDTEYCIIFKENYINPFSFSGYVLYGDPRGQFDKNIAVKKQKTLVVVGVW